MTGLARNGAANLLPEGDSGVPPLVEELRARENDESIGNVEEGEASASAASEAPDGASWRNEVAARLERYRTRRKPRSPRYPSLLLPFESPESWGRSSSTGAAAHRVETYAEVHVEQHVERHREVQEEVFEAGSATGRAAESLAGPQQTGGAEHYLYPDWEQSSKVIEFPRSAAIPMSHASELADPIFDRPRIVEAPEVLPPPPALGGMLIEPLQRELAERRSDTLLAAPSATIAHRALAALADGVLLLLSLAAFAGIFLRFNAVRPSVPMLAGGLGGIAVLLWMVYKFLLVVYSGASPGMRIARLQLVRFDGRPVGRGLRRWRILASFLSAFSAGLGYLWCVLDEDGLCWHDRITRTHLTSVAKSKQS